ncbi:hypothetical protein SLA2020_164090 [Shorea laevis]
MPVGNSVLECRKSVPVSKVSVKQHLTVNGRIGGIAGISPPRTKQKARLSAVVLGSHAAASRNGTFTYLYQYDLTTCPLHFDSSRWIVFGISKDE